MLVKVKPEIEKTQVSVPYLQKNGQDTPGSESSGEQLSGVTASTQVAKPRRPGRRSRWRRLAFNVKILFHITIDENSAKEIILKILFEVIIIVGLVMESICLNNRGCRKKSSSHRPNIGCNCHVQKC